MERRLSAILAADIVGYSAQMERDEAGTFARLSERRKDIFEPEIARHGGRIFKTMGDGILAEFASVVQAVECAVVLQTALEERNRDVPEDQAIRARIGINLGEVIVDGDDRYGEGVNIAARLEQLAEAGGICVSDKVAREVEKKLAFGFQPMGPQRVKNIAEPVMAFRVSRHLAEQGKRRATPRPDLRRGWGPGAAIGVIALVAVAAWLFLTPRIVAPVAVDPSRATVPAVPAGAHTGREGLPVLHVLPFVVGEGVPEGAAIGNALARAVAQALGPSPELASVVLALPDAAPSPEPSYLLTGRVSRDGSSIVIGLELVDAATGAELWSGRRAFAEDRFLDERDRLPGRVHAALLGMRGEVTRIEEARTWEKPAEALTEHDHHLRGLVRMAKGDTAGLGAAVELWREGLARFPESALLRLDIAEAMYRQAQTEPTAVAAQTVSSAWALVGQAETRQPLQAEALQKAVRWRLHLMKALLLPVVMGDFETALDEAQQARRLMPRDPQVNADMALVMANAGWERTAIAWARDAVETQYDPPDAFHAALGWALYLDGRPAEAVDAFARMADPTTAEHAAALIAADRDAEGQAMVAALRARNPDALAETVLDFGTGGRFRRTSDGETRLSCHLADYLDPVISAPDPTLPEGLAKGAGGRKCDKEGLDMNFKIDLPPNFATTLP